MNKEKKPRSMRTLRSEARIILINHVQSYEFLWNIKHMHFFNRRLKLETWQEIARKMQEPTYLLRRGWENLRDHYRRELKREHRNGTKSKWRYFELMSFLRSSIRQRYDSLTESNDSMKEDSGPNVTPTIVTLITTATTENTVAAGSLVDLDTQTLQMQLPPATKLTLVPKPVPLSTNAAAENKKTSKRAQSKSSEISEKSEPDNELQQLVNDVMNLNEKIKTKPRTNAPLFVRKDVIKVPKLSTGQNAKDELNQFNKSEQPSLYIKTHMRMTQTIASKTIETAMQTDDVQAAFYPNLKASKTTETGMQTDDVQAAFYPNLKASKTTETAMQTDDVQAAFSPNLKATKTVETGIQTDVVQAATASSFLELDENMKFFLSLQNDLRKLNDKEMLQVKYTVLDILVNAGKKKQ